MQQMSRYKVVPNELRVALYSPDELKEIHYKINLEESAKFIKGEQSLNEAYEEAERRFKATPKNKR